MKKTILMFAFAAFVFSGCSESINEPSAENGDLQSNSQLLKNGANNAGETGYSCDADGELVGYEGECPSVGVYEYTLWAGKYNNAGTVSIWADDANLYVEYNTNETADLGEAHVYVWTDLNDVPDKRPSPGQAPYMAENINADSYTFTIEGLGACGSTLYISTHAALIGEGGSTDGGDDSNEGETAYGGGPDSPICFDGQKGAWWGYVNFTVECFYEVSGTVYEDANNNGDLDGENGFGGITVTAAGTEFYTTTTAADGSYSFLLPANDSYTITSGSPAGDYLANENAAGFSIVNLSECLTEVDFGFVPLYDITVDLNLTVTGDCVPGVVVAINGVEIFPVGGNYVLENQLPAAEYTVVVTATSGDEVVSETQTITYLDANTTLTFNMSFTCPSDPPGPGTCEFTDGQGSDGNSFELGAFFPYFIDGAIKFEGNSLGEDGQVETVTFVIYSENEITSIDVATKSGNQSEDDTILTYRVGDSFTDVGGYTITWDASFPDPLTGKYIYTFTVTSDGVSGGGSPALSHISFYPNCP